MSLWAPGLWANGFWSSGLWSPDSGLPPSIIDQPDDATATVGQTATFTVSAIGAASYQWEVQVGGVGGWANVASGGTSASYTTAALALTDSGNRYRVIVTNANGSVTSSEAGLTVTARQSTGGAGSGRNYIIKGRQYRNVTNRDLAVLIAREFADVQRDDVRVSFQNKTKKVSNKAWAALIREVEALPARSDEFDDDEEAAAMLLM